MDNLEEGKLSSSNRSLSDLPDDILQHILSFFEPTEAARMSILSKRWRYVNPTIDLRGFPFSWVREIEELSDYVDRAIFVRHFVKSFHFICLLLTDIGPIITRWIEGVVLRNVQDLSIKIDVSIDPVKLPCCLFSCKSLVHLDLCMPSVLQRPPTICFSSLKTLKLKYVKFSDEHSTNQLLSSCPVLEDLCLSHCWFLSNVRNVNIHAPKLLRLTIDEDFYGSSDHGCRFMVHGTNLKHYACVGTFKNEHYLYNQSSLEEADIGYSELSDEDDTFRFCMLLGCLSNVKILKLNVPTSIKGNLLDAIPMFKYLTHLELCLYDGVNSPGKQKILQNSPCLEYLKLGGPSIDPVVDDMPIFKYLTCLEMEFKWGMDRSNGVLKALQSSPRLQVLKIDGIYTLWIGDVVPPCIPSHLKVVEVTRFTGDYETARAVKSLLNQALVLEKLFIRLSSCPFGNKVYWEEYFSKLPKGSEDCEIVVCS